MPFCWTQIGFWFDQVAPLRRRTTLCIGLPGILASFLSGERKANQGRPSSPRDLRLTDPFLSIWKWESYDAFFFTSFIHHAKRREGALLPSIVISEFWSNLACLRTNAFAQEVSKKELTNKWDTCIMITQFCNLTLFERYIYISKNELG